MKTLRASRSPLFLLAIAAVVAACAPPMPAEAAGKSSARLSSALSADPAVKARADAALAAAKASMTAGQPAKNEVEMRALLSTTMPEVTFDAVRAAVVPGFFEVQRGAQYGYVSADGQYLISGDLVNLRTGEEITEKARKTGRLNALAKLGDDYIEFDPPNGKLQHVVTVFTDVDCGYCRKLHSELASYNALGIGFRYVFFPRSGPGSPSFHTAEAVWCSADRKQAFTIAKQGGAIPPAPANCKTPVQKEYDLGVEFGLRGTPMLVLPDGEIVNGYVPANQLAAKLATNGLTATMPAHSAP